jgi:hypothetical protein
MIISPEGIILLTMCRRRFALELIVAEPAGRADLDYGK